MKIWPFRREKKQSDISASSASIYRASERFLAENGQQVYCLPTAKPSLVRYAVDLLTKHHDFQLISPIAAGGNEVVAHIRRDDIALYVSWDCWMGFDILSLSDAADPVVLELGTYLDGIKYEPRFASHFDDQQDAEQASSSNGG